MSKDKPVVISKKADNNKSCKTDIFILNYTQCSYFLYQLLLEIQFENSSRGYLYIQQTLNSAIFISIGNFANFRGLTKIFYARQTWAKSSTHFSVGIRLFQIRETSRCSSQRLKGPATSLTTAVVFGVTPLASSVVEMHSVIFVDAATDQLTEPVVASTSRHKHYATTTISEVFN